MPGRLRLLLLLLVPQLIGWFWLSLQLPHLETPWFSWHNDKQLMLLEDQDYRVGRAWFASVLFDLEKETWWVGDLLGCAALSIAWLSLGVSTLISRW